MDEVGFVFGSRDVFHGAREESTEDVSAGHFVDFDALGLLLFHFHGL